MISLKTLIIPSYSTKKYSYSNCNNPTTSPRFPNAFLFAYFIAFSVLIEKLLRTCDVETIYILMRGKKNDDIDTRVEKIFDDPVSLQASFIFKKNHKVTYNLFMQLFERVRKDNPKFRHKIVAISGDCMLPGLGINPDERALLIKHVNIVFHVAATVRFVFIKNLIEFDIIKWN